VLHAVEILWESISDEACDSSSESPSGPDEQLCLALSKAASGGSLASRTIRLQGSIAGVLAILLIDSSSSTSFISSKLAARLSQFQEVSQSAKVQVASGGFLHSPGSLNSVPWSVAHCNFCSNFRILELTTFDVIVGMDWLQAFSPMQIHWEHKWLAIPYNGSWTALQGLDAVSPDSVYLQLFSAEDLRSSSESTEPLPPPIQH
jgi:hypothetical protein